MATARDAHADCPPPPRTPPEVEVEAESSPTISQQVRALVTLALPVVGVYALQYGIFCVPFLFLGRLSAEAMGAYSLAQMFVNCTGNALGYGFVTALDTIASQAWGSKNFSLVGLATQRAVVIMTAFCLPMIFLWMLVPCVLFPALGVHAEVSRLAILHCRVMTLGMWPAFMYEIQKKYLANQGITTPGVVVMIPALGINCLCNYLLVPRIGFAGASVSIVTSLWVMNILLFAFIRCGGLHKKTWPRGGWRGSGWDSRCLRQWPEMFRLGTPGALMLVLEWGIFEVNAFLAARLGANSLACHGILAQTAGLFYMLPLGMGVAVTTLVGNALGEAQPETARRYMCVGMGVGALFITMQVVLVCFILRDTWASLFTNDETVVTMVTALLPWFALFALPDETQGIMAGAFRGMGRQMLGAKINAFCYPVVGLTLSYTLSDPHLLNGGILGIWQGLTIAVTMTFILYACFLVCFADWESESRAAVRRSAKKEGQSSGGRGRAAPPGDDYAEDIEFTRIASLGSSEAALFPEEGDVDGDVDGEVDGDDPLRRVASDVSLENAGSSVQLIGGPQLSDSELAA